MVCLLILTARKESSNRKLKDENIQLEQEVEGLNKKIQRMNTMQRQVSSEYNVMTQYDLNVWLTHLWHYDCERQGDAKTV